MLQYQKAEHFWACHIHLAHPVPSQTTKVWDTDNILKSTWVTDAVSQNSEGWSRRITQGQTGIQRESVVSLSGISRPCLKETEKQPECNGTQMCRYGHCLTGTAEPPCGDAYCKEKRVLPCTLEKRKERCRSHASPILRYRLLCESYLILCGRGKLWSNVLLKAWEPTRLMFVHSTMWS